MYDRSIHPFIHPSIQPNQTKSNQLFTHKATVSEYPSTIYSSFTPCTYQQDISYVTSLCLRIFEKVSPWPIEKQEAVWTAAWIPTSTCCWCLILNSHELADSVWVTRSYVYQFYQSYLDSCIRYHAMASFFCRCTKRWWTQIQGQVRLPKCQDLA